MAAKIVWHDVVVRAEGRRVLRALSALGDVCIDAALAHADDEMRARYGTPRDAEGKAQRLVVLGMGKLGGRELNFSSDVDLILAYPSPGSTDGTRTLSNEEYFTRQGRKLVELLDARTEEGFVYRVDMRLRPYGSAGRLALSFDAMEHYYQREGRDWERYAFIKARPVAGDIAAGEALLELLQPFVYRRYLDFAALDALREMKSTIEREYRNRDLSDHVKLGPGGIRELEFMVQSLQLIWGGREPGLRQRTLLDALDGLAELNLIAASERDQLSRDYLMLRTVENRIQMVADRQVHELPSDSESRERLATTLDFANWRDFSDAFDKVRARVRRTFDQVLAAPDDHDHEDRWAKVWREADQARAEASFADASFQEPEEAARRLLAFRDGKRISGVSPTARERIDRLMPALLRCIGDVSPSANLMGRAIDLIEAVARRSAYVSLLLENAGALQRLVELFAASSWVADWVIRRPVLLDELIATQSDADVLERAEVQQHYDHVLTHVDEGDLEAEMDALREAHGALRLRVASARLLGAMNLRDGANALTLLAEETIAASLRSAWRDRGTAEREAAPMAVVAYGTVGGRETHFASDLDLVFLHANDVQSPPRMIRVAQRAIHFLTTLTTAGRLYEVDTRLRPNGSSGLLVSSLRQFERYQLTDAWTWEHQALSRARVIAGDPELAEAFERIRREVLTSRREEDALRRDVVDMREKMRGELDRSKDEVFDFKQGLGGLADIAFMAQFGVLNNAHRCAEILGPRHTCDMLQALASCGAMAEGHASQLIDAWYALVEKVEALSLQQLPARAAPQGLTPTITNVKQAWRDFAASAAP